MKKAFFIIIILLVAGGAAFFFFYKIQPETPNNNQNGTTTFPLVPEPDDTIFVIPTPSGNIEVENFFKHPLLPGAGSYEVASSSEYIITYFPPDRIFQIAIIKRPAHEWRGNAETKLLEVLGIPAEKACTLNVSLGVPFFADPSLSGKDYNLSFCPDGIPF